MGSIYLVPNSTGRPLTDHGLKSTMSRFKKKMIENGLEDTFWTLHDLKHKGITDSKDKNIGGHRTKEMIDRYNHEVEVFEPPR